MKDLKQKIEVMQAALDGKEIEYEFKFKSYDGWITASNPSSDYNDGLEWNWENVNYRIKPEPMEFWVNVYEDGELFSSKDSAEFAADGVNSFIKTIKVREVTEE